MKKWVITFLLFNLGILLWCLVLDLIMYKSPNWHLNGDNMPFWDLFLYYLKNWGIGFYAIAALIGIGWLIEKQFEKDKP